MALNYYSKHEDRTDTTEHLKDSRFKTVVVGFCLPSIILCLIIVNLFLGKVVIPYDYPYGNIWDGFAQAYEYGMAFAGVISVKAGLAFALHAWYGLANIDHYEHLAIPLMWVGITFCFLGMVVYVVAVLV